MSAAVTTGPSRPVAPPEPDARRHVDVAIVVIPMLIAAALSLIALTDRSLGFDEGATVTIVSQSGHALWQAIARDGGNMSGYYLLLHVLVGAFGDGPWVLRLPSMVFAAFTPGLVGAIALTLWGDLPDGHGRRAAAIAGLLAAVSVPLVYWAQVARGYAPMMCLGCASVLAYVRFVVAASASTRRRAWAWPAAAYVVVTGAAAYCGFIVLLLVVVQLLALVRRRRALTRFLIPLVGLIVVCIPLAVLALRRGSGQLFWVPRPNRQLDTQVVQSLTSAGLQSTLHRVFTTTPGWILTCLVLLGLIALALRSRRAPDDSEPLGNWGLAVVLGWIVVPGLIQFVISLVAQPVLQPRNTIASVPAVALALGFGLADRRLPRWLAVAGILAALLIRAVPVAASYGVSSEPWARTTRVILAAARPGDCIAFYPEDARNNVWWYVSRGGDQARAPRSVLPDVGWKASTPYVERYATLSPARVRKLGARCRRMWLVFSHEGQPDGPAESRRHLTRLSVLRARLRHVFGPGRVRPLGWASVIHVDLMKGRRR